MFLTNKHRGGEREEKEKNEVKIKKKRYALVVFLVHYSIIINQTPLFVSLTHMRCSMNAYIILKKNVLVSLKKTFYFILITTIIQF
jgi:hypothetical protein